MSKEQEEELLLPRDTFLTAGIHIGAKSRDKGMEQYIFKIRPDGLAILDIKKIDEKIRVAAKFLSRFDPASIAVVSAQEYGGEPIKKFCELVGAMPIVGRFVPGTFSNPTLPCHVEPSVVLVTDPRVDFQAMTEAALIGIPVVALCSTDNNPSNIDLVIPINNKGRKSLATFFWLLAREILRERGDIGRDEELSISVSDFEAKVEEEVKEVEPT